MSSLTKFLCLVMSSILKVLRRSSYKHQKLREEWDKNKEPLLDGLTFYVKCLGSCLVESSTGERITAQAVKSIVAMAKVGGKKLERVSLAVSPQNIRVINVVTKQVIFEVPINRISYCSADAHYNHVFAFILSNSNDVMECYAFLCSKRKMAQAITLTISQAFNVAYDLWQVAKHEKANSNIRDKSPSQSAIPSPVNCDDVLLIDLNYQCDGPILNQNSLMNEDSLWQQSFVQFANNSTLSALESSLADEGTSISQFVIDESVTVPNEEFFQDDTNDLLLL